MTQIWNTVKRHADEAEHVVKFVFEKPDAVAEAVLYRYPTYEERTVICCSVMSGCPIGCRFCGSGDYFVRNLTGDEIVAQVLHCVAATGVNSGKIGKLQIMFMSMGEPMLNIRGLEDAIERLSRLFPSADLLVSTSAPDVNYGPMYDLSKRFARVGLQFSIHESTDEARNELIPFAKKLTLREIALVGEQWCGRVGRKPFINYCAHDGNSSYEDADRILELFRPDVFCATVSVVCERSEGIPATNQHQKDLATGFAEKLVSRGFDVRVFDPAGQDTIGGGCGQLWFVQNWMKNNPDKARPTCGNGLDVRHAPTEKPAPVVTFGDTDPSHPYIPILVDGAVVALGVGGLLLDQSDAEAIAREAVSRGPAVMTPAEVEAFLASREAQTMTLDEAIQHALDVSNGACGECAANHRQLAEWLMELRKFREVTKHGTHYVECENGGSDTYPYDSLSDAKLHYARCHGLPQIRVHHVFMEIDVTPDDEEVKRILAGDVPLEWTREDLRVHFDDTMVFGQGYDWEGWEHLREEAHTKIGRFVVWPDRLGEGKKWSLYGGNLGWCAHGFASKEAAKKEVEAMVRVGSAKEKEGG